MGLGFGTGHHQMHTRHVLGACGIDVLDARMGTLGAHRHCMQAVTVAVVVAVATTTGDQASVLAARERLADPGLTSRQRQIGARIGFSAARRDLHRLDDVEITGAATEVAGQRMADVVVAEGRVATLVQKSLRAHHHAGRAITALHGIAGDKGFLQGAQVAALAKRLDAGDMAAVGAHREHQAGLHGAPVQGHRARTAGAFLAADARALDAGVVAQEIHQ